MNVLAATRTALRALRKNKLRSFLAALGIVIAVAAVVATVAIGQGAQAKVAAQMASLGSNLLMIMPGSISQHGAATGSGATQNLTRDDAQAIEKELTSSVSALAPMNRTGAQVVYGGANWFTQVIGTTPAYLPATNTPVQLGRSFTQADVDTSQRVILLGQTAATELFTRPASAVGQTIKLGAVDFTVLGVLASKDSTGFNDPRFVENWKNMKAHGVVRGSYQFFRILVSAGFQPLLHDRN